MKKKKAVKKLQLSRETLQALTSSETKQAVGAEGPATSTRTGGICPCGASYGLGC